MTSVRLTSDRRPDRWHRWTCRSGWCLPTSIRRFADRLLNQQLWCWGQDVKHPSGNLLIRYGLTRNRPYDGLDKGSTCYRLDLDDQHVALWGFGVFFGSRRLGGLYLARYDFQPVWGAVESLSLGIHVPEDLPVFHRPRQRTQWRHAHRLLANLLKWIVNYERWVITEVGEAYRNTCVTRWLDPTVPGDRMRKAWYFLSQRGWEQHSGQSLRRQLTMQESGE